MEDTEWQKTKDGKALGFYDVINNSTSTVNDKVRDGCMSQTQRVKTVVLRTTDSSCTLVTSLESNVYLCRVQYCM